MDPLHDKVLANNETIPKEIGVRELRDAIPGHCFRPSYIVSLCYLLRDILGVVTLAILAAFILPQITSPYFYTLSWCLYGFTQGLFGTGLWVLAHECGHGGFSQSQWLNDAIGWSLHSMLLTPYFAWKSTHRRHHLHANHMERDHHYVPYRRDAYAAKLNVEQSKLEDLAADTPVVTTIRIIIQQTFGWPWYLLFNLTSGPESTHPKSPGRWWQNSHFDPTSSLFSPGDYMSVIISDIGIGLTISGLWYLGNLFGSKSIILFYVVPWLWVNHWIVAITYLHHTHPSLSRYEQDSWSFLKGALATVDRDFGWVGRFFFHNIIDFHVIHHLFSQIPFYHAEEATRAIVPILGSRYYQDKASSFVGGLWQAFTECQWVEPGQGNSTGNGELRFQKGPSPAPEYKMRHWKDIASTECKAWM
ncbi:hypothetical protein N7537_006868 [Penicillium hordei]|uniref:Fatty acid desaturase domain-containing protein n=1 Tax=Penicillium hordei TaxID=40994 RepID=A0AAD6H4L1_9EURO|nr:uncharacterized protein N7537_006868 [Penicillium hordei]KAJ5603912.1 hypothetical protein N7537_006868 [Penicillium hordei]